MAEQEFGPLRSRSGKKPWPECPDLAVYRCDQCGRLYQALGFEQPEAAPACCAASMERLKPLAPEEVSPEIQLDYKIVGGFNQSAVQVSWETTEPEDRPEWMLLKTFTGGYLKYLNAKKRPPLVFPLSDEDAYVYCDTKPCKECLFRCKRGFVLYAYVRSRGLLEMPLERMSEYFT